MKEPGATTDETTWTARLGSQRGGRDGGNNGTIRSGNDIGQSEVCNMVEVGTKEEKEDCDIQAGDEAGDRAALGIDGTHTTHKNGQGGG